MAAPTPAPTPSGGGTMIPAEWPAQAADAIVDTVGKVRDKTTKPAITAAKALVYGLIIAVLGTMVGVLFVIAAFRGLNHVPGPVWIVYAVLGVLFSLLGIGFLRAANHPKPQPA